MLTELEWQQFNNDGYLIIKNFWDEELLASWEQSIILFYLRQASKISSIHAKVKHLFEKENKSVKDFDSILSEFENGYKEPAYHVLKMLECSQAAHKVMSSHQLTALAAKLLNCPESLLIMAGINPFINLPSSKRLLYHYHSESCYYPKRRNFLNIWFPIFRSKNIENGTMWFCKKSHTIPERHFIEYQGYDRETEGKRNHFIQYEIPECELTEYEKVPVIAERRDLVCFHRNMVHTSTLNASQTPSYASVMRIFDFSSDLTLSGDASVRPYNDHGGISELIPIDSCLFQ